MNDVAAFEGWLRRAEGWAEASQALVSAGTDLSTSSRDLADRLDGAAHDGLPGELRELATAIERDTREYRDRYLTTSAELDQYREILD